MSNGPALPKGFMRGCLLLLLGERSAHGYELLERLQPIGFDGSDPGGVYRGLRGLEGEGLVRSAWADSPAGPHKRIYELTETGRSELDHRADDLSHAQDTLSTYLARYRHLKKARERDAMWPAAAR